MAEEQQVTKEPQQVATKEPQQVTTKNPNKVKAGIRLAEYNWGACKHSIGCSICDWSDCWWNNFGTN